jgi:asparagine synthase (glutamine-hydrolysing)
MCGISGVISDRGPEWVNDRLNAMVSRIQHRGPDEQGATLLDIANGAILGLGHTRLSIIDLAQGHQPFTSADGRYVLIYNGEIYNYLELRAQLESAGHVFRTHSDTEVLLEAVIAWGYEALPKLRGMFAFALWDHKEQSLCLARDHFGEKPLLYAEQDGGLAFASELPALAAGLERPLEIDDQALATYLVWKYLPGPKTLAKGVRQLRPGHYAVWRNGVLNEERFYAPPRHVGLKGGSQALGEDQVREFRELLTDSVRLKMRSDVEVGAFLSGGLDSSVVVALMAAETPKQVKTFSVGFKEQKFSELWAARMISRRYNTDHHEIVIEPHHFIEAFDTATWHRGAPMSEYADVPVYWLSRLAAEQVKVVLSGEGSDEMLAGYPKHWGDGLVSRVHRFSPAAMDRMGLKLARSVLPRNNHRIESLLRALGQRPFAQRQAAWFGSVEPRDLQSLAPGLSAQSGATHEWPEDPGEQADGLSRALLFDQMVWLPNTLLERADRMLMAASVEGRMPFLDPNLAELVSRLPRAAFLNGRTGKMILRRATADLIPEEIVRRPKHGFRVPIASWFRNEMREFVHDNLLSPNARVLDFIPAAKLREILSEHETGARDRNRELWSILALEFFLRHVANNFAPQTARSVAA